MSRTLISGVLQIFLLLSSVLELDLELNVIFLLTTSDNILFSARLSLQESFQISENYSAVAL